MAGAVSELIRWSEPTLWIATASVVFNPLFWNIVARQEHKNKILTRLAGGNPYWGCYGLAATIFLLGILRDHLYTQALALQPTLPLLQHSEFKLAAIAAFVTGGVLVLSSMWALGVTGTYLGDYFGILMDDKVDSFPFNVTSNPMYYGSTLSFLGTALWYESPAGLLLTVLVFVEYKIALLYEEPFTAAIYAAREATRAEGKSPKTNGSAIATRRKGKEL